MGPACIHTHPCDSRWGQDSGAWEWVEPSLKHTLKLGAAFPGFQSAHSKTHFNFSVFLPLKSTTIIIQRSEYHTSLENKILLDTFNCSVSVKTFICQDLHCEIITIQWPNRLKGRCFLPLATLLCKCLLFYSFTEHFARCPTHTVPFMCITLLSLHNNPMRHYY